MHCFTDKTMPMPGTSGRKGVAGLGWSVLAAAVVGVAVGLTPVKPAQAAINVAVCEQAAEAANNFYNQALANTKLYPTAKDAAAGAERYVVRRIREESGTTSIRTRADAIDECATRTTKGKRHYGGLLIF